MGYAIVGYFDKKSDERIKNLWGGMAEIGVDNYLINSDNNPHFKFIMYEDLDVKNAKILLEQIAEKQIKIPIQFKSYSFYPNNKPFINIDIAVKKEILELQKTIRNQCDRYAKPFDVDFFDSGIWKPDCQLTIEFDKQKLSKGIEYLANTQLPFNGNISRLGIIEFHPAKQIVTYELNSK